MSEKKETPIRAEIENQYQIRDAALKEIDAGVNMNVNVNIVSVTEHAINVLNSLLPKEREVIEEAYDAGWDETEGANDGAEYYVTTFKTESDEQRENSD